MKKIFDLFISKESKLEKAAWENALLTNDIQSYKNYLNKYHPKGKYATEAKERINVLVKIEQEQKDENAWETALSTNDIQAYENYLNQFHPNGKYVAEAKERINKLTKIEKEINDEKAWQVALRNNTSKGYDTYLDKYPKGEYINEAKIQYAQKMQDEETPFWENTLKEDDKNAYYLYWTTYPNGKYVEEALKHLKRIEEIENEKTRIRQEQEEKEREIREREKQERVAKEMQNQKHFTKNIFGYTIEFYYPLFLNHLKANAQHDNFFKTDEVILGFIAFPLNSLETFDEFVSKEKDIKFIDDLGNFRFAQSYETTENGFVIYWKTVY